VAGAQAHQGRDPRHVSQPGLFRLGRIWRGGCVTALFRQERARCEPFRSGSPCARWRTP
jgi:hypothetical protein